MKRSILTVLVALMMITGAFAQGTAASDATVTADVLANLTLSGSTTLDFGNVASTSTPIVDPTGASHTDVAAATAGSFTIGGQASSSITVNFDASSILTDVTTGLVEMTFTPDLNGNTANSQAGATADITSGSTVSLSAGGAYYLWLGGDLGSLSGKTADAYSTANGGNATGPWGLDIIYN